MEVLEFLLGDEQFAVYRTVTPGESEVFRALLGSDFRFPLEEGEPLDDLVFDVLAVVAMRSDFYFTPPPHADVLGTFELRDTTLSVASKPAQTRPLALRPRTH
jgi:hypothetical protein